MLYFFGLNYSLRIFFSFLACICLCPINYFVGHDLITSREICLELRCFEFIVVGFRSIAEIRQISYGSQSVKTKAVDWNLDMKKMLGIKVGDD